MNHLSLFRSTRTAPVLWRALALCALAGLAPACSCGKVPAEVKPAVAIGRPTDAQRLTVGKDDDDTASPGFQFSVEAKISNVADGSQATLLIDGNAVPNQVVTVHPASGSSVTSIKFDKPTLLDAAQVSSLGPAGKTLSISVKVVDKGSGKSAADTKTVTVAQQSGCSFVSPASGATLGLSDDKDRSPTNGEQVDVKVACTDVADNTTVKLTVIAPDSLGGTQRAPVTATLVSGSVTFPGVSLAEGQNILRFEAGTEKVDNTVTVDTGGCAVWLGSDDGAVDGAVFNARGEAAPAYPGAHPVADLNTSRPGVQARFTARVDTARCPAGSTASLSFNGAVTATGSVGADGKVVFDSVTIPDGDPMREVVSVVGSNEKSGTSLPNTYHVDSVVPDLSISRPNKSVLTPADDEDSAASGLQTTLAVHANGGLDVATTQLSILDGSATLAGPISNVAPDASGNIFFPTRATLATGSHTLVAKGVRRLGNTGQSSPFTVQVLNSNLTLTLVSPTFTVCNISKDEVPSTTDVCDVTFDVLADASVTSVAFDVGGVNQGSATPTTNHHATLQLALPQGIQVVNMTPSDGNGTGQSLAVTLQVDTIAPTITWVTPTSGATLTSQANTLSVQTDGSGQVTFTSSAQTGALGTATVASGAASLSANLPSGAQTLTASVSDTSGNPASASIPVTVSLGSVCDVVLTAPSGLSTTYNLANTTAASTDSGAGARLAHVAGSTSTCLGQAVTVSKLDPLSNGAPILLGTATADATTGAFALDVPLADGEADFNLLVGAGAGANAGSVTVSYTADFTPPTLVSGTPAFGNVTIVAAGDARAGTPGFVADSDSDVSNGAQLAVSIDYTGGGAIGATGTGDLSITEGLVRLGGETPVDNGPHTFAGTLSFSGASQSHPVDVTLTDAAGNAVVQTWTVTVDLSGGTSSSSNSSTGSTSSTSSTGSTSGSTGTSSGSTTGSTGSSSSSGTSGTTGSIVLPTTVSVVQPTGAINVFNDLSGNRVDHANAVVALGFSPNAVAGTQVRLCTSTQLAGSPGACLSGGFEVAGTRSSASGAFKQYSSVQFPEGALQLFAEVDDGVGNFVDSPAVSLSVDTVPPSVTALASLEDGNSDGRLSNAELPSGQALHVTATFSGVEDGRTATLSEGSTTITQTVASGTATFAVPAPAEGNHTYKVTVSDAAGNPNESSAVNPPYSNAADVFSVIVQRTAPSISVVAPTFAVCNKARDTINPGTSACELDFQVAVGASATSVDFTGTGAPSGSVTPSGGLATARFVIPDGASTSLQATVHDAAGNTNSASAPMTVDTTAPTLAFTSPSSGSVQTAQQYVVTLSTNAEDGQTATVTSSATSPAGNVVGTGPVSGGVATVNVTTPVGTQTLTATVSDAAGNPATAATLVVTVTTATCDITFTTPASSTVTLNQASGATLNVAGRSVQCPNTAISFFKAENGGAEVSAGSTTTDATGHFTQSVTFTDGSSTVFRAAMTNLIGTNSVSFTALTDVTPPTISVASPTTVGGNLFVVAASNNKHIAAADPGYLADADSLPGGQLTLDLTFAGAGPSAGSGQGTFTITAGSTTVLSQSNSSNSSTHYSPSGTPLVVTLPQAYVGPVVFTATDAAGNSTSFTWSNVTVDVVAPSTPAVVTTDPGNGVYSRVRNERHADLSAVFTTPTDNGPAGQTLTWDVRYSTSTLLNNGTFDVNALNNAAQNVSVNAGTVGASGSTVALDLNALPPLNTYYFAPRLVDGVGNVSDFNTISLNVNWTREDISYPGTSSNAGFGSTILTGDIDGDGKADIAVGASLENTNVGSVWIFYGASTFPLTNVQHLVGTGSGSLFGFRMALGDINGDGHADLITYDKDHVVVFLAPSSGGQLPTTPSFTITGDPALFVMTVVGDINNDGISDLIVGDPFAGTGGKVNIYYGRHDWSGFAGTPDVVISNTNSNGNLGGYAPAMTLVPDIDSDGFNELFIGDPNINTGYLFLGKTLDTVRTGAITAFSPQTIVPPGSDSYFGISSAVVDFNYDNILELVIGDNQGGGDVYDSAQNPTTHVFAPTASIYATGSNFFGSSLVAGDISLDGHSDLIAGTLQTSHPGALWVFFSGSQSVSATPNGSAFGGPGFGTSSTLADVNGDGKLDIVVSDPNNGNGVIHVIH